MLIGIFNSLLLVYLHRYKVERESMSIQLAIDYQGIKRLQAFSIFSDRQILTRLKNKGLTTILLREIDQGLLEKISETGLHVMLMISNFGKNTGLEYYFQELKKMPNLSVLILADKNAFASPSYVAIVPYIEKIPNIFIGIIEFYHKENFSKQVKISSSRIIRVHSILGLPAQPTFLKN